MNAYLSPCRTWRYSLTRDVAPLLDLGTVTFIGLNPSTADETVDDPTVRRCIGFAQTWGYSRLKLVNLYAFRATDPDDLFRADDPIGPDNDCTIAKVIGCSDLVVCAWGARAPVNRAVEVFDLIGDPRALRLTQSGAPYHPLYVRGDARPLRYRLVGVSS